jgi:hypothetical protein
MTDQEIVDKASEHQEWRGRKRMFMEYLNSHQDPLSSNAR